MLIYIHTHYSKISYASELCYCHPIENTVSEKFPPLPIPLPCEIKIISSGKDLTVPRIKSNTGPVRGRGGEGGGILSS